MSTNLEKIETLKTIIKLLHEGKSVQELKEQYSDLLRQVSPLEIPFLEQQLVREGLVSVNDILKLCDLHVELFRESLETRTLQGVPSGHPLDLLMKENDWIAKRAEILGMYASSLLAADQARTPGLLENINRILGDLKKLRLHYRKLQMIVFPYLERRGIIAVPRVLWGREDQALRKLRELSTEIDSKLKSKEAIDHKNLAGRLLELSREIQDLAFREAKILFPALWTLLGEGEWVAIHEIAAAKVGLFLVPIWMTLFVTSTGPIVASNLKTIRAVWPLRDEIAYNVAHWHMLSFVIASAMFFLYLDEFTNIVKDVSGWLLAFGGTLALAGTFVYELSPMFVMGSTDIAGASLSLKKAILPVMEVGLAASFAGFAIFTLWLLYRWIKTK